jgi:Cu+-exporting ATPase
VIAGSGTGGGGDRLTRTTLEIEGGSSPASIAAAIRALQRVPGVLLADMHAASTRAVVAHDGAVDPASFVRAVAAAGIRASIVRDTAAVSRASTLPDAQFLKVFAASALIVLPLTFVAIFFASAAERQWLLPLFSLSYVLIFFVRSAIARRR